MQTSIGAGAPVTVSRRVLGLRCRACGQEYETQATHVCPACFGPLDVAYDYAEISRRVSRASIEAGPTSMWRYRDLLPLPDDAPIVSLGEGLTPLIKADRLGAELGLRNLYLKNDSMNPTNSFKDRVVSVAISWGRAHGFQTFGCASTGNLANSVAAYSARAGMDCYVFIPDDLEAGKVTATSVFQPHLVAVRGNYDQVNRLCSQLLEDLPWGFCNLNLRPFYAEGSKTLTYETAEQLGWRLPDEIVIPIASGCQFVRHRRAVGELIDLGLAPEPAALPRLTGAQALGCAPVYNAWRAGSQRVQPVRPDTIARSIAIGNPSDGGDVVRIAAETGGVVEAVSEPEIVDAIRLLARTEGIFTEPAGGVTIGVLAKLARSGRWSGEEVVVAYVTGHGLKAAEAVADSKLDHLIEIDPSLRSFQERVLRTAKE
ncbi:MAG: threonine synthase [Candidatus Dormibacter sp.]|uniref:threonine synthase n=1 Tax=Candidatus Dormibacter sp. TaxID=2973982 RepID=UPI000DB2578B|nr:MAG: threonine synthase [Candidatus Dormibacteraeota bacterium]